MEVKDLRELTIDELIDKLAEAKEALADYRLKLRTGQTPDTSEVKRLKKTVAKILTVINEKHAEVELGAEPKAVKKESKEEKETSEEAEVKDDKKDKEETK